MWKIASLILLLPASAFGSVDLQVNPAYPVPDQNRRISLELSMANNDHRSIAGYWLWASAPENTVKIISRTNNNPYMDEAILLHVAGLDLSTKPNLGYSGDFETLFDNRDVVPMVSLLLEVAPNTSMPLDITIEGRWFDLDFANAGFEPWVPLQSATISVLPEPACLILLVGALASRIGLRRRKSGLST